jgi:hypothetical protein
VASSEERLGALHDDEDHDDDRHEKPEQEAAHAGLRCGLAGGSIVRLYSMQPPQARRASPTATLATGQEAWWAILDSNQ